MDTLKHNLLLAFVSYATVHFSQTTSPYAVLAALFIPPALPPLLLTSATRTFLSSYTSHILAFTLYVVLYRLSPLHPLYKYPGPLLPRISKLYLAYVSISGRQHLWVKNMHDKYGDVIRVAPNELSFITASSIKPIYGNMPKAASYTGRTYNPNPIVPVPIPAIRIPSEHARRRKPWQIAFSGENIKNYVIPLEARVQQLVECLERYTPTSGSGAKQGQVADLSAWFERCMYDFMTDMAFDGGSELMRDEDSGLWNQMIAYYPYAYLTSHIPWLPPLIHRFPIIGKTLCTLYPQMSLQGAVRFRQFAVEQANARKARGSLNKDLFYHFITAVEGSDNPMRSWLEVMSDTPAAIIAGSDTTSTTLAHIFFFLLTHPEKYQRLKEEIDQDAAEGGDGELPYTHAVINETLRLYPPGLSGSPRSPVIGSGGMAFDDHFITEDTICYIPFYALQRNPKYFSDPDAFVPERWLDPSFDKSAWIPFSHGPSNCVGKNLAIIVLRTFMKALVSRLEFTLVEDKKWNRDMWVDTTLDFYVTIKGSLPVRVSLR